MAHEKLRKYLAEHCNCHSDRDEDFEELRQIVLADLWTPAETPPTESGKYWCAMRLPMSVILNSTRYWDGEDWRLDEHAYDRLIYPVIAYMPIPKCEKEQP